MAWRRQRSNTTTVRWPSSEPVGADARRDRSFVSCLVTAMNTMLATQLVGGAIPIGVLIAVDQLVRTPDWLTTSLVLGGLAAGSLVGMHLVTTRIWGPRLSVPEQQADLLVRDDRFRGAAFAVMSWAAAFGIAIGVAAIAAGSPGLGVAAVVAVLASLELAPSACLGLRVTHDELEMRRLRLHRIDRAEIIDMGIRQRFRGWSPNFYIVTRDEHLTPVIHAVAARSSRRHPPVTAAWVDSLRDWWQHGFVGPQGASQRVRGG